MSDMPPDELHPLYPEHPLLEAKEKADRPLDAADCYASLFWRTMDTAPKDGTEILAYKPDYGGLIYMVRWCQPEGQGGVWVQESGGPWLPETDFTHWIPLPPFPSQHNA